MNTFLRSSLVATLATVSLVAVVRAGDRAATVESPGVTSSDRATSIPVAARGKPGAAVPQTSNCDANRDTDSVSGAVLRDARIARMDFENARSVGRWSADTDDEDRDGIVPAIYTWKPETRFVFYRNIGKWM